MVDAAYPLTDVRLAQRLEGIEAATNIAFVEARARLQPSVCAACMQVGGVAAMFDGPESPLTQTFGLGLFDPPGAAEFEALEAFFQSRAAPVHHEVSPLASPETLPLLTARGYYPVEYSTVLVRPTSVASGAGRNIRVREIQPEEALSWSRIAAEGWSSESGGLAGFVETFGPILAQSSGIHCFLAELDGRPVAAGTLSLHGDTALLAGASTIPSARRKGAQLALLAGRLAYAASRGADLAMMVAQPGSASQRNAERQGFRTAYTRTKWRLRDRGA
jgi:hypothetical protein